MSGLGLEPAFRRGLGLGVGFLSLGYIRLIKAGAGATALHYRMYGLRRAFVPCWPYL